MHIHTYIEYELAEGENPIVTQGHGAVYLHARAKVGGFSVRLLPAHLPRLREAVAELEAIAGAVKPAESKAAEQGTDLRTGVASCHEQSMDPTSPAPSVSSSQSPS